MAVKSYEKDGKIFWQVYVDLRGRRSARIRMQKRINGIETEKAAEAAEKRLVRELSEQIAQQEAKGDRWCDVIDQWESRQYEFPSRKYAKTTIIDNAAILRNWTKPWLERTASELNRGDGREIDRLADAEGKSARFRKQLKSTINVVYTWGIEERLIIGALQSPVYGLDIKPDREEIFPEILTAEEIRNMLRKAQEQNHPWYPVWVGAVLTGCRSGELHQLKKCDLEIISREQAIAEDKKPFDKRRYGSLRVRKSWSARGRAIGPTKAGYWRNVPVSSEFYWFLVHDLKAETKKSEDYLLPRFWEWDKGEQARILRMFCISNKIPSIRFHTLRACFATQLISSSIPPSIVMKICGWRDLKTMQRYVRLAGVDESGATEVLRFIPTEEAVMEKVVSLYDYKNGGKDGEQT
ncbi:MAG: hypothetical protein A2583_14075 [Bdellovibrionales bacterium RIFOXYD1_FULL_53_11]|nr:MAG: hypothetical protein A2583_14075 [Bdellovibrionales bacterium RIFOXYD1_FULL_53_11]